MLRAGVFSSESVVNSWGQAYKSSVRRMDKAPKASAALPRFRRSL
jgi:hypothetical protein